MPIAPAEGAIWLPKALSFLGCAPAQNLEPVISGMIPGNLFRTAAQPAPECFNPGRRPE
jgi:hypothetical protein